MNKELISALLLTLCLASTGAMAEEKVAQAKQEEDPGWTAADVGKGVVIVTGAALAVRAAPRVFDKVMSVESRPATFSALAATAGGVTAATMMQSDEATAAPAEADLNSEE